MATSPVNVDDSWIDISTNKSANVDDSWLPVEQTEQPESQDNFLQRLYESFGKGLGYQAQLGAGGGTKALPLQAEAGKQYLSGSTLGISEHIPGLKTKDVSEEYGEGGKLVTGISQFAGELNPIHGLSKFFNLPMKAIEKSPYLAKPLSHLYSIVSSGLTGASLEGAKELASKGEIDTTHVMDHGILWAGIDATLKSLGLSGMFAKNLYKYSKDKLSAPQEVLDQIIAKVSKQGGTAEEIATRAFKDLEDSLASSPKPVKSSKPTPKKTITYNQPSKGVDLKTKKVSPQEFETISNRQNIEEPSKPITQTIKEIEDEIAQPVSEAITDETLNTFEKLPETKQETGQTIRGYVNNKFKEAKETYTKKYEQVGARLKFVPVNTSNLVDKAEEAFNKLNALSTKPAGYATTLKDIESTINDAGYVFVRNKKNKIIGLEKTTQAVSADKLIELSKRLGEIADFESTVPSVKDALKPLRKLAKQDALNAVKQADEATYKTYIEADKLYSETANKFGVDPIQQARYSHYVEDVPRILEKPTALDDFKKILSPKEYRLLEREVLQNLNEQSYHKAKKLLRELKPKLSPEAQGIADNIVLSKAPKVIPTAKKPLSNYENLEKFVIDQLNQIGKPEKLLKLWNNDLGRKQIRHALRNNPNKDQIIQYLQKGSFFDNFSKVVDASGNIDLKAFDKLLKDKIALDTIKDIGGQDAVNFFKEVRSYQNQMSKNKAMFDRLKKDGDAIVKGAKESKWGQAKLDRIKQQNIAKAEKKINLGERIIKQANPDKYSGEYGKKKLKAVRQSIDDAIKSLEYPYISKIDDLYSKLGPGEKLIMSILGFGQFGLLKPIAGAATLKGVYELVKNRAVRQAAREVMKQPVQDFLSFFVLLRAFGIANDEAVHND